MTGSSEQVGIAAMRVAPAACARKPLAADGAIDFALERRRKLAHMLPGTIPFGMLAVYHEDPLPLWNLGVVIAAASLLTWFWYRRRMVISRRDERWALTCIIYSVAPLATLCLFPHRPEFAGVVLVVTAFGDAAAGLGGMRFGRSRLPWNSRKTWSGTGCFLLASIPLATLLYWAEANPAVSVQQAATCAIGAGLCAAAAESLPLPTMDNLRVGLAAALGVVSTHALFFGAA